MLKDGLLFSVALLWRLNYSFLSLRTYSKQWLLRIFFWSGMFVLWLLISMVPHQAGTNKWKWTHSREPEFKMQYKDIKIAPPLPGFPHLMQYLFHFCFHLAPYYLRLKLDECCQYKTLRQCKFCLRWIVLLFDQKFPSFVLCFHWSQGQRVRLWNYDLKWKHIHDISNWLFLRYK